jgi:bifunctional UDP-N-acetylglucosamine pyrophosphorylase/glucosamine-1-phosphate N-acetyltransferase
MKLATVILAAGKGTRMKSSQPKVLHAVAGRPMIEYSILLARALESDRIVCVLGHEAEAVRAAIDARFGAGAVEVVIQAEQRGTGHAVSMALPKLRGFDGPVLILYGDVPLLTRELLARLVRATGRRPLGLVTARMADPTGYGRIVRDNTGRLERIVEQKDASARERGIDETNAGIYCVHASFLARALKELRADNAQGELYLTDIVGRAAHEGEVVTVEASPAEVMGVNDRVELATADARMRRRINEALMRGGVTLRDPESCYIDASVEIGRDTEIGPMVQIRGATRIGERARIDAGCVLSDCVVGDGAHLKPYTVVAGSEIGADAQVGPFAHLRPESLIGAHAKIGNFVETKKARFGMGAKASHLSYLGDCEIGAEANIGCGTITCNYDGYNKSRTVVGEGAFIGSDTQLVAPVTVGARAVVAAGTTVTEDVPPGALVLTRAPLVTRPGYYEKKREREEAKRREKEAAAKTPARAVAARRSRTGGGA